MPNSILYLSIMIAVIIAWFMVLKRPVYEAILISFFILLTITGTWGNIWTYIDSSLSTSLIYSMVSLVAMSILLTETKVIDVCIAFILSLVGHIPGGAGYAAVIASAFMGALSGSGPGNVMATGSITIPAMKHSGMPPELAANIESNASYMGNMIPPSSNIMAALGAFTALYPAMNMSVGRFWIVLWGIAIWFILQRMLMVWYFCKHYNVQPMVEEDIPNLKETLKSGWEAMILPIIILLPFVIDFLYKDTFITARLGAEGAKYFSSSILLFIGGVSAIYTCLIAKDKSMVSPKNLAKIFANSVKTISPSIGVCILGYMIGALFNTLNVAEELGTIIMAWDFGKIPTILAVCIITCFMGMVIPGSSIIVIFGPMFITTLTAVGVNPVLAAGMLPCICGVMCGITPPLGLGMYAGMALAESDFEKTFKNNLWWVAAHFILEVGVLMGMLPIIGL